jgi:hypothetical protein
MLADLLHHYQQRLDDANASSATAALDVANYAQYRELEGRLRAVERSAILRMRDQNQINDEVLRRLERELDLLDARHISTHL